jgi:hypothetical protein
MLGTLPSANKPSLGGRVARAAAKGTLRLGSATFNKMFPTIGRAMARVSGSKDADGINTSSEDISRNLSRQTDLTRTILENQQEQNRILEKILTVYGSGQSAGGVTPTPVPTQTPPPAATPGLNFEIPMPDLPDRRQPPRPAQQPPRPAPNRQRSFLRRYLTYMKRKSPRLFRAAAKRIALAAAGAAVPGPGWILSFISALSSVFLAYELYQLYKEFSASNSEEEEEDIESNLPSAEEEAAAEREIQIEAEKELYGDVSQIGVQEGEETARERDVRLDQASEAERRRLETGLTANLQDVRRQMIMEQLAAAEAALSRNNTPPNRRAVENITNELANHNRANPITQADAARITTPQAAPRGPTREELLERRRNQLNAELISSQSSADEVESRLISRGSMGASMDAEMGLLQDAQDRARPRGSIGSSMDAEFASVSASVAAQSAAVRVEGDTIIYDFEKIKFEAERIKFEGLSLPTQQTMAEPTGSAPPATPSLGGGGGGAAPAMATAAGGGPPPASGGMQPIQMMNQAPTVSPMVQGMMDRRQGGTATSGSAAAAMQFFQSSGWSPAQAAGLAANLQVESNFNPSAVGDGGRAYGIAQWHPDRQAAFQRWSGQDIRGSTFEQQLGFINFELTQGNERRAGTMIRQATTPEQAAAFVDQYYERSNGHARQRRMQLAASFASNMPVAAGQQPVAAPSSSAPALAQASVDRIAANREQISNTHRMLREFNQNSPISNEQLRQQEASRIQEKKQMTGGEVSLRDRLLSVFDSLARAS